MTLNMISTKNRSWISGFKCAIGRNFGGRVAIQMYVFVCVGNYFNSGFEALVFKSFNLFKTEDLNFTCFYSQMLTRVTCSLHIDSKPLISHM